MKFTPFTQFAANEYGCGAYGSGSYNENCTTSTGGGGTSDGGSAGGSGGLSDTGMNMMIFLAIGIVLVAGSALYLFKNLHKSKSKS